MAKYLVETYYTCTFKVNHYLDDISENEIKNIEKRDDGKFEVLDVKLDNRKTKSLDPKNNKIVLIQQFRPGTISRDSGNYLDEIVGGIIDPGETPENTAKRECLEETGCTVKKLSLIQEYFPAPGSSESFYHLFLGEVDAPDKEMVRGLENENEDILVKSYSFQEVKEKLEKKQIINGLTLIALQWFFLNIYKT